jgi:hypothetical protein
MKKLNFLPAAALLAAGFIVPAYAQMTCEAQSPNLLARANGNTELLGDIILICTGGTPTAAGNAVPQVNIEVFLNTNLTSKITYTGATDFSEALLLIDEPNVPVSPTGAGLVSHPVLNCGQTGAPDKGPSGPGVCEISSTGNPAQTYDGTPSAGPTSLCYTGGQIAVFPTNAYGCGRPNVFQARYALGQTNLITFNGVPIDPPGAGTRYLRITNLRGDAAMLNNIPNAPITALVNFSGSPGPVFQGGSSSATLTIGTVIPAITATVPSTGVVRVTEGFASAWKDRNVEFQVKNAMFSAGNFVYVPPDQNYPAQAAQNVSGVPYNTEDGFQWQNNGVNAPPNPNPPGWASGTAIQTNAPFASVGYGGINTGISTAGVSSAGTRIALTFQTPASVTVPNFVYLHRVGSPSTTTGVMVLTATDANGAGAFNPTASTTIHNGGMAVYEVLFADPFEIEYADIPCTVNSFLFGATASVNLAPFYSSASSGRATPTAADPTPTAIPRFFATNDNVTLKSPFLQFLFDLF